jgi:hypothetical protein
VLYGRGAELVQVEELIAAARDGHSGALDDRHAVAPSTSFVTD